MTGDKHTSSEFDQDLETIASMLMQMGGIAEAMIADAAAALSEFDTRAAERAVAADPRLDALQESVESHAVLTIARRQPVANDLRAVVGAMRIASNLERVGDLAENVAKRSALVRDAQAPRDAIGAVKRLAEMARQEITDVLDAYAAGDVAGALDVWRRDEAMDGALASLFREMLTYMAENPRTISACTHLLFCAKNIERIGDHATNIAETVHYIATGRAIPGERPKVGSADV